MDADRYQLEASKTAGDHDMPIYTALGIAGEAGELADLTKKWLYHGHPYDKDKFISELGDILWYVSQNAVAHELLLSEVMEYNLNKLKKRYPKGFSSEKSINRDE